MYFYLIGIDYKNAPIDARERFYRKRKDISAFWESRNDKGSAVLVTCNRIEVYGATEFPDDAFAGIRSFFKTFPDFARYAYVAYGEDRVFQHALRVAAGLESQIKGELEISGQLKRWVSLPGFPAPLKILWDEALLLSQDIRQAAGFNDESNNLARFIFDDLRRKLPKREGYEIMVIGTGKIAGIFAQYKPQGAHLNFVAHKNFRNAKVLAEYSSGKAWHFTDTPLLIPKADAIISATKSPHYVLKKKHFEGIQARPRLYIYDLALPRDVEPEVGEVAGVSLYNLDDLNYLFSGGQAWLKSLS